MNEETKKLWFFFLWGLGLTVSVLLILDLTGLWPEARTVLVGSAVLCVAFGVASVPFYCLQDRRVAAVAGGSSRSVGVEVSEHSAELNDEDQREAAALKARIVHELFPGFPMDEETLLAATTGSEAVVCAICLEPFGTGDMAVSGASCEHLFHRSCVLQWLTKRDDNTCPTCRSAMWTDEQYDRAAQQQQQKPIPEQPDEEHNED